MKSSISQSSTSSSTSVSSKHLKEQVKMVAGELENVLGELKTVVGDLRVLVTQIDEVTSKIDDEYGLNVETLDKSKRRLSTSVLETNRRKTYRLSASQSFDLTKPNLKIEFLSAAEIRDLANSNPSSCKSYSPERTTKQVGHLKSKSTSMDEALAAQARQQTQHKQLNQFLQHEGLPVKNRHSMFEYRTNFDIKRCESTDEVVFGKHKQYFDHIPRAGEIMAKRIGGISINSRSNVKQTSHPNMALQSHSRKTKRSKSFGPEEYSGVYEKELDSLLEVNELENYDSVDESFTSDRENFNVYKAQYDRGIDTWKKYKMVHIDSSGYSDEQLSETTETLSDLLNDNCIRNTLDTMGIEFTDNASIFSNH